MTDQLRDGLVLCHTGDKEADILGGEGHAVRQAVGNGGQQLRTEGGKGKLDGKPQEPDHGVADKGRDGKLRKDQQNFTDLI